MRTTYNSIALTALAVFVCRAISADAVEPPPGQNLRQLRDALTKAETLEGQLRPDEPAEPLAGDWSGRRAEFQNVWREISRKEQGFVVREPVPGASRNWADADRVETELAPASMAFLAGPEGIVSPANGELLLSFTDMELPSRAGLGFAFRRTYSSFRRGDLGLGPGWECNWTPSLVFERDEAGAPTRCKARISGHCVSFRKGAAGWEPQAGQFLDLEVGPDSVAILSPDRVRWLFEKSVETPDGWRLREIATRHDKWTANRLVVSYLPNGDRIRSVTDCYGNTVRFSYDANGHIVQISSPFSAMEFRYENGLLVETETSRICISLGFNQKTTTNKQTFQYETKDGALQLHRMWNSFSPAKTDFEYDARGRIVSCTEGDEKTSRSWGFTYEAGATIVSAPFPTPRIVYHYGSAPHPSLPDIIEIPSRMAKETYEWNDELLVKRKTDSIGVTTLTEYDGANARPSLRGNLLVERVLPASEHPSRWKEFGTETEYLADTDLPVVVRHYQVASDGKKDVLKTEKWEYSSDGDPVFHDDGGLIGRAVYNRYGLPALEMDGNENVSIHYYAVAFPETADGIFLTGSPTNGGPETLLVEDAKLGQMIDAGREIGLKRPFRTNNAGRLSPVARETKTAWAPWGHPLRVSSDRTEELFAPNAFGMPLAECVVGRSLSVSEYSTEGQLAHVLHLFDPAADSPFKGQDLPRLFKGRFFQESFKYDSFQDLIGHAPTDEPQQDGTTAWFRYERLPSGKMSAIVNPAGIRRADEYDKENGWLLSQKIVGQTESAFLYRVLARHPDGEVKAWEDSFGGAWANDLDGFGRVSEITHPNGMLEVHETDCLGREIQCRFLSGNQVLADTLFEYDPANGLFLRRREWDDSHPNGPRFVVTEEHRHDKNGNVIARRGVQKDSWETSLFDGLNRAVAVRDPSGGIACTVWREGLDAFAWNGSFSETAEDLIWNGEVSAFDAFGRCVKRVPVSSEERAIAERKTTIDYDAAGRITRERQQELTETLTSYDSLGNVTKTELRPLNPLHGEKPSVTRKTYHPDGRIRTSTLENVALGIFGKNDDANIRFTRANQTTTHDYDDLGRLVRTSNPDGLIVSRVYNERSLPSRMIWTHASAPEELLRDLRFSYTKEGAVSLIVDNSTGKSVARYEYDRFGRCTKAIDSCGPDDIVLERAFTSLGELSSERVRMQGAEFPAFTVSSDNEKGVSVRSWAGLKPPHSSFWTKETVKRDGLGRLKSISLDDEDSPGVEWSYVGAMPARRSVYASDCQWSYTPLFETKEISYSGAGKGRISYSYGPQGQVWSTSVQFPGKTADDVPYEFSSYTDSDAFRRHVAQNSERRIDPNPNARRGVVLGASRDSLSATTAGRYQYDQAGNTVVRYNGVETIFDDLSRMNDPHYVSPARLLPGDGSMVGDLSLLELASNREATKATYNEHGDLTAESNHYDLLGNTASFTGTYWDGERRYSVEWTNRWDVLGRLERMEATALDDVWTVRKGQTIAELRFRYDAGNRRIEKTTIDRTKRGVARTTTERTLYDGNTQKLVFRREDGVDTLVGEYLWGGKDRELLFATLRPIDVEDHFSRTPIRYHFQQDAGLNVVRVLKESVGRLTTVSTASYLGFGENATYVPVRTVRSSLTSSAAELSFNNNLDDSQNARWDNGHGAHFLELTLVESAELSELTIWTGSLFPKDFSVFVVGEGDAGPDGTARVSEWALMHGDRFTTSVQQGAYLDAVGRRTVKGNEAASPYRLSLGGLKGNKVVLVWDHYNGPLEVREFEVLKTPSNPAPIAFAGQWLDQETGLYYQINRYREAGSEKFLSPDPLGFLAGPNLYAYANNNPLEWHDPDGRFLHVLLGAGVGALLNGGIYSISTWISGEEFSWRELGIQMAIGAVVGAVGAATFGASSGFLAARGFSATANAVLSGAVTGTTTGFTSGFAQCKTHGGSWTDSLAAGGKSALLGTIGGAVGGGVLSQMGGSLSGVVASGAAGGGVVGAIDSAWTSFQEGDEWESALSNVGKGLFKGAFVGGAIGAAGWGVGRASGMIKPLKGYPDHLPDPRNKGLMVRTNAYGPGRPIPKLLSPFKSLLSYRDAGYDGVTGQIGDAIHHIKPLSLGGTTTKGNLVPIPAEQHSFKINPANAHPGSFAVRQRYGTIFY